MVPSLDGTIRWNHTMATPLEKARRAPESMKGKILTAARRVFGEYSFHGATTRMIAKEVGIDISTLYYHWGEKLDLYEAVIVDINEDLRNKLIDVESIIHGKPLKERMEIAINMTIDYLFENPEISNLVLFSYFGKTRQESRSDIQVPEFVSGIAKSMNLPMDGKKVSVQARMQVLAIMNAMHNFISGKRFFGSMLELERKEYIAEVKKTLKFILIPAFTAA